MYNLLIIETGIVFKTLKFECIYWSAQGCNALQNGLQVCVNQFWRIEKLY